MPERAPTGGEKVFEYSKEDLKRIRSEDTESTSRFKKSLGEWREKRAAEKERRAQRIRTLILFAAIFGIAIAAIAIGLLLLRR